MIGPGGYGGGPGDGGFGGGGWGGGHGGIDPGGGGDREFPAMAEPRERHREPRAQSETPEVEVAATVQDPVVLYERQQLAPTEVFLRIGAGLADLLPVLLSGFAGEVELWRRVPGGKWDPVPVPPPAEAGQ